AQQRRHQQQRNHPLHRALTNCTHHLSLPFSFNAASTANQPPHSQPPDGLLAAVLTIQRGPPCSPTGEPPPQRTQRRPGEGEHPRGVLGASPQPATLPSRSCSSYPGSRWARPGPAEALPQLCRSLAYLPKPYRSPAAASHPSTVSRLASIHSRAWRSKSASEVSPRT